jgi:hypothetical protein
VKYPLVASLLIASVPTPSWAQEVPCWQVEPTPSDTPGWVSWEAPGGQSYGIPDSWDVERSYQELEAAGLCVAAQSESVADVTSYSEVSPFETAEPTELQGVAAVTPESGNTELRARLDQNLGGNSVTTESGGEDDWGSIIFGIAALIAMGATAKDYVVDPVSALAKNPNVLPSQGGQHQPQGLFRKQPAPAAMNYIQPTQVPEFIPVARPVSHPEPARSAEPPATINAEQVDNTWVAPSIKSPIDVAQVMAKQERPTFIVGPDRVGKGMTVQYAYRAMKAKGYQVWLIQPKPAAAEKHYWADCDNVLSFNLSDTTEQETAPEHEALQSDVREFIASYRQAPGDKKLLIMDELFMVSQVWPTFTKKFVKGVIAQETSSGVTYGRLLWTITQNGQLGDIGISGGSRALFDLVAIERPDSYEHWRALSRSYSGLPEIDPGLYDLSQSPKRTVIYHSAMGEWFPMVAYPKPEAVEALQINVSQAQNVLRALSEGLSDSQIIKDVLGYKGREYATGKQILEEVKRNANV